MATGYSSHSNHIAFDMSNIISFLNSKSSVSCDDGSTAVHHRRRLHVVNDIYVRILRMILKNHEPNELLRLAGMTLA